MKASKLVIIVVCSLLLLCPPVVAAETSRAKIEVRSQQYDSLMGEPGSTFKVNARSILDMPTISYGIATSSQNLLFSNNPETITKLGIVYQSKVNGKFRFVYHHYNRFGKNVTVHLLVTNNNLLPVSVHTASFGSGGPSSSVALVGKMASVRYMTAKLHPSTSRTTNVKPQQTIELTMPWSKLVIRNNQAISGYIDLITNRSVTVTMLVRQQSSEPIKPLASYPIVQREPFHIRGTFTKAHRTIAIGNVIGRTAQRLMIGDRNYDSFIIGTDQLSKSLTVNKGNFGVSYQVKLAHVAPNTVLLFNARGGLYTGALIVNKRVIHLPTTGHLTSSSLACVLYRTGAKEEQVDIEFIPALGSNLPVALVAMPLPKQPQ